MTDWLGLQGKIAAITGGGGGIGRAVALGMAKQGVTPVLLDRDMAGCDQTLAVLRLVGVEARAIACDIAGFACNFAHHACAHVFILVFKIDFLGNRYAVFGYQW